jgi:Tol biopolymer transport system component
VLGGPAAFAWNPTNPNQLAVVRDTIILGWTTSRIYLVDFNGSNPTLVTELPVARRVVETMDWSPDGSMLAFGVANDSSGGTEQQIWTLTIAGAVLDTVSFPDVSPADLDMRPVFSPDGSELLFVRIDGDLFNLHYVIARSDGTGERVEIPATITADGGDQYVGHDWSPDGSQIVLLDENAQFSRLVYVVPSTVTAVTYPTVRVPVGRAAGASNVQDKHPSWRP